MGADVCMSSAGYRGLGSGWWEGVFERGLRMEDMSRLLRESSDAGFWSLLVVNGGTLRGEMALGFYSESD